MKYDKNKTKKKKCGDCKQTFLAKMHQIPNIDGFGYFTEWESQCRPCHIKFNREMLSGLGF